MKIKYTVKIRDTRSYGYLYEEALKTLRTNIQLSGRNIKSILFTSTHTNEGKSEISFQIAVQFAKAGKKVIYIDADRRKASSSKRVRLPENINGLTKYLSGQCSKDDIAFHTNIENFDIIMACVSSPNPSELFEDDAFGALIKELEEQYDYVIIDTAPIGMVIDAAIIGQVCDGAVFVVSAKDTSTKLAQKSLHQLKMSGCKILGAVMNMVDPKESDVYGKYGKYGKYGYGVYGQAGQ